MEKINAIITGVGGYVPEYVLNNEELSRMVDTNDEWIMTRIGIKERRILNEEGLGTSYMARKAVRQLLEKTGTDPQEVDCLIIATTTPPMVPSQVFLGETRSHILWRPMEQPTKNAPVSLHHIKTNIASGNA